MYPKYNNLTLREAAVDDAKKGYIKTLDIALIFLRLKN